MTAKQINPRLRLLQEGTNKSLNPDGGNILLETRQPLLQEPSESEVPDHRFHKGKGWKKK